MKETRFILICILSPLLLCCCTKESDNDTANSFDGSIGFAATTPWQSDTRGTPLGDATGIRNMGVYAYYTGNGTSNNWAAKGTTATPDFLNGITVTQSGGVWSYANTVYWPQAADANVSFFAYSPVTTSNNGIEITNTTGVPKLKFTVPTVYANQPDLLVALPKPDLNKTNTGTSPVKFSFKHALTSIGFKLAGGGQKVTSIKIKGVRTNGTLSMDGTTIAWADLSEARTTEFSVGLSTSGGVVLTSTLTNVLSNNGFLMMIPQSLGTEARIIVSVEGQSDVEFPLNGTSWESGKKVNYSITLKTTPELEISIEDWVNGFDTPVKTDPVAEPGVDIGDWGTESNETVDY